MDDPDVAHSSEASSLPLTTMGCSIDAESVGSASVSLSKKIWHGNYMICTGRVKPIDGEVSSHSLGGINEFAPAVDLDE